jgi:lipoprotein LprG
MLARVTRRGLTALAAAALLLAVTAACGGSGPTADELVAESVAATSEVESFHLVLDVQDAETSDSGLSLTSIDGDVLVPDRLEGRVGGKFLGIPISTDLVVADDRYYLKTPFTGEWREIDVETLPSAFFDPEQGILAVIQGADNLERDGSEDVAGVACYRITGDLSAEDLKPLLNTAEGSQTLAMELWIGEDDKLLRRLRLTGPISSDEDDGAVRTVELSAFDEPVEIDVPETS